MEQNFEQKLKALTEKPTLKRVELRRVRVFAPTRSSIHYPQGRRRYFFGVVLPTGGSGLQTVLTDGGKIMQVSPDFVQ